MGSNTDVTTTYNAYDAIGNMTGGPDFTDPAQVAQRTFTYNADNMPVRIEHVKGANTVIADFVYDGGGQRAKKSIQSGSTTYYIGAHYEIKDGSATKYIFAGNTKIAMIAGSSAYFFHKDHLGSSTAMTDENGVVVETTKYLPFGLERSHTGAVVTNYKFTGQELDPEVGLYNYNARLYDPVIGVFISADAIVPDFANPQSLNRYAYCINNPLLYVDPSGQFGWVAAIVGAVIGAVSAGSQSDWDPGAMLTGAAIGFVAGGVGGGVYDWTYKVTESIVAGSIAGGTAGGATAGGLSAGVYGGNIGEGILTGAGWGAVGGAAFGAIGVHYGGDWPWHRIASLGLAGGGLAELQGGEFSLGFTLAAGSALAMKGWQKIRDITDASSIKSRSTSSLRRHPVDNELDTVGNRPANPTGNHRGGFGASIREGTWSGFNKCYGRFANLVSKVHDFSLSWNYDGNGMYIGRGPAFNFAYSVISHVGMVPAGVYTAFAFSSTTYQPIIYQERNKY